MTRVPGTENPLWVMARTLVSIGLIAVVLVIVATVLRLVYIVVRFAWEGVLW